MVEVIRLSVGIVAAIGLGVWAWRVRSGALGVTALGYLAAVVYLHEPAPPQPGMRILSAEEFSAQTQEFPARLWSAAPLPEHGYPEFVLAAGAVLAHALAHRVRPWHAVAVVGLLGGLWEPSASALCLAAIVLAGYDLHARRPGVWYPLLVVGVGLWAAEVVNGWWIALDPPEPSFAFGPASETAAVAISFDYVDHVELTFAVLVAACLAVLAWRRRNAVVLFTAAACVAGAWVVQSRSPAWAPEFPTGLVVLAGAAVACVTAAPGTLGTAGTPGRPPRP